jgi:hypothetical protein
MTSGKCSCFGLRFPVVGAGEELCREILLRFGGVELMNKGYSVVLSMPVSTSGETRTWTSRARATQEHGSQVSVVLRGHKSCEINFVALATSVECGCEGEARDGKLCLCRVLRDVIPPTPPGPEGSNGNGSLRAQ